MIDRAARYMAPVERKPVGFEREIAELQGNLRGPPPPSPGPISAAEEFAKRVDVALQAIRTLVELHKPKDAANTARSLAELLEVEK